MISDDLTNKNSQLNNHEYNNGDIELQSYPQYIMIELTQGCNLTCPMCRDVRISPKARTMPDEIFSIISEELLPMAKLVDLRGWGESLLLPHIDRYIRSIEKSGRKMRFVTNLNFRRDDILELLVKNRCQIAISLDTIDQEIFSTVRGGGKLDCVTRNIGLLTKLSLDTYGNSDQIYISSTVQNLTIDGIPSLVEYAGLNDIHEIRLFSITIDPTSIHSIQGHEERVNNALIEAKLVAKKFGIKLIAGTRLGCLPENPIQLEPCIHPWSYACIHYDGTVGFCDHLIGPEGQNYNLGNLHESTFSEIWNNDEWQKLRLDHITNRSTSNVLFNECRWCYKNRYIDFEYLFNPNILERIVYLHNGGTQ